MDPATRRALPRVLQALGASKWIDEVVKLEAIMTYDQIREMLSDIIQDIDYDIWKQGYNSETAECSPAEVSNNYAALISVVRQHLDMVPNDSETLDPDTEIVTVCDKCLCASCWQGIFYCDDYRDAGIVQKTVAELRSLNLENPDYWKRSD